MKGLCVVVVVAPAPPPKLTHVFDLSGHANKPAQSLYVVFCIILVTQCSLVVNVNNYAACV